MEKKQKNKKVKTLEDINCKIAQKNEIKQNELKACKDNTVFVDNEFFVNGNTDRTVYDVVLANLIVLAAIFAATFVPIFSLALPILLFIYLEIGLWGFVLNKEMWKCCKYEDIFVSIKRYTKFFCMAVAKLFMILFWTICLIVPGIICALNYSFTGIILYESPDLDVKGTLMLSKELTKGYRWNIFFWWLLSLASICAAMTIMFFVVMFFDMFMAVSVTAYIILVLAAGMLDFVVLVVPMIELSIVDYYILAKRKKVWNET